jgi:hypothetical protein
LLRKAPWRALYRALGIASQAGLLLLVYWRAPALVDVYVETLFLSTIAFSVAKAGANFASTRERLSAPESGMPGKFHAGIYGARMLLGVAAILVAALLRPAHEIPLAAFLGVAFGASHNIVYRRFLAGSSIGSLFVAFFGFAHFAAVLGLLLLVDASLATPGAATVLAIAFGSIILFIALLRSNVVLMLGELAYSYAYPLLAYVVSAMFVGPALMLYFLVVKVLDAASMLLSFVLQPHFYTMSEEDRDRFVHRIRPLFEGVWFLALLVAGIAAALSVSVGNEIALAAVYGFAVASAFLACSLAGFILVSRAKSEWTILTYGIALCLLPVGLFASLAGTRLEAFGCLAAVLAIWVINYQSRWHRPR